MELKSSNKIRLICLLIAGPSLVSFNAYGQPNCIFNGYNVGGGLGVEQFASSISSTVSQNNVLDFISGNASGLGVKGNLYAGYSATPNSWLYLGAELGLNVVSRRQVYLSDAYQSTGVGGGVDNFIEIQQAFLVETDNLNITTAVSRSLFEPTFDVKGGVLLAPNLLSYARLGLAYNRMSVTTTSVFKAVGSNTVDFEFFDFTSATFAQTSQTIKSTKEKNVLGLRAGAGLMGMITPKLGISADYVYTLYNVGTLNRSSNANEISCDIIEGCSVDNKGKYKVSSKPRASDQEVLMQLIYYFS